MAEARARGETPPSPPDRDAALSLRLEITRDCILRCRYCFLTDPSPQAFGMVLAGPLAEFLRGTGRKWRLHFTGGEPLLNLAVIARIVEECESRNARVEEFGLTTNGVLADRKTLDYLAEKGFAVNFSLDGPEEVHLRNRRDSRNRINSHKKIMAAVRHWRKNGRPYGFSAVFHLNTLGRLDESVEFLLGLVDDHRRIAIHPSMGYAWRPRDFRVLGLSLKRLICRNPANFETYADLLCQSERDFICSNIYVDWRGRVFPTSLFANKDLGTEVVELADAARDPRGVLARLVKEQEKVPRWEFDEEMRTYAKVVRFINRVFRECGPLVARSRSRRR